MRPPAAVAAGLPVRPPAAVAARLPVRPPAAVAAVAQPVGQWLFDVAGAALQAVLGNDRILQQQQQQQYRAVAAAPVVGPARKRKR